MLHNEKPLVMYSFFMLCGKPILEETQYINKLPACNTQRYVVIIKLQRGWRPFFFFFNFWTKLFLPASSMSAKLC